MWEISLVEKMFSNFWLFKEFQSSKETFKSFLTIYKSWSQICQEQLQKLKQISTIIHEISWTVSSLQIFMNAIEHSVTKNVVSFETPLVQLLQVLWWWLLGKAKFLSMNKVYKNFQNIQCFWSRLYMQMLKLKHLTSFSDNVLA